MNRCWLGIVLLGIVAASVVGATPRQASAQEIGYVEQFALAESREAALRQLVPGTEDYYFYHALVLQQAGRLDDVKPLLTQWEERHGQTDRWRQITYRQVLLGYDRDPAASLDELRRLLNLQFNHQRAPQSNRPDLPTELDQDVVTFAAYLARAYAGNNSTDGVAPSGLYRLLDQPFDSPARRRSALSRLTNPDFPGLADLVIDDLRVPNHGVFGNLPIHRSLTLAQLDRCLELDPKLVENSAFVETYLTKLWPGADVDAGRDDDEMLAYLERLWTFVEPLPPVHNALKAQVLHQRLSFDLRHGEYDKPRFMTYLRLPRNISYMRPEYLQRPELRNFVINLQQDFSQSTRLPAINDDEPLVRAMLDHFLLEADNIDEFAPYVRDSYLNSRLAEVKILAGQGDPERWATLLGPAAFQQLRERIDLEFVATNAQLFKPGEPVALELDIKNVETLIVKVFEINARNYYEQEGREVNTDISLDGLVANHERVVRYDDSPLRRLRREFTFPEIDHPGVYVIDFIGNGRSSRALVRPWTSRVRSTMPVSSFGPRPPASMGFVDTWCQMCSSTPSTLTSSKRAGSASAASSSGRMLSQTVRQPVPSCRRMPLTDACSRRICSIAHHAARVVSFDRGAATDSSCSRNVTTGQPGSRQRQRRLRQSSLTGRPIAGASTSGTGARP